MTELETLIQKRNRLGAEMMVLMFQIIAILLLPVALVLYAGGVVDSIYHIGKIAIFCATASAVSVSWISIWKIYKKVDTQMTGLDSQILKIKKENGYDPKLNLKRQEDFDKEDDSTATKAKKINKN